MTCFGHNDGLDRSVFLTLDDSEGPYDRQLARQL